MKKKYPKTSRFHSLKKELEVKTASPLHSIKGVISDKELEWLRNLIPNKSNRR